MTDRAPHSILRSVAAVLLDFDGPVCSIFAGLAAPTVAAHLRVRLTTRFGALTNLDDRVDDPLEVLRYASTVNQSAVNLVEQALRDSELDAATTAQATPGAREFLSACRSTGRPVVVVSNNSGPAIEAYLVRAGLASMVTDVVGRVPGRPDLMKPHPELLHRAIGRLRMEPARCVIIGDSVTDIQAGHSADVLAIGYANKPGKHVRLTDAGADAVTDSMLDLAVATERSASR